MKKTLPIHTPHTRTAAAPDVTLLLSNPKTVPLAIEWAYPQLHDIAVHYIRQEPPGCTLQPTALVNEACVRLLESDVNLQNRHHLFGVYARLTRQTLVDAARKRSARKRGGDWCRVDFSYAEQIGFEQRSELLDFDAALKRLEHVNPKWSRIAELRVFAGLSTTEAANISHIAPSTARKHWADARRWLRDALRRSG